MCFILEVWWAGFGINYQWSFAKLRMGEQGFDLTVSDPSSKLLISEPEKKLFYIWISDLSS